MSATIQAFLDSQTALKRFLGRMLPVTADVEDVAQEALLRAFVASSAETVLMPKAFLFRIARNLAINERARMWNTATTLVGDSAELDGLGSTEEVSSEDRLDSDRKMMLFHEAIAQLPSKCRHVFLLRKVHELSYIEIARQMGISVSTVEKHIAMGLVRCGEYLNQRGYGVGESAFDESLGFNGPLSSTPRAQSSHAQSNGARTPRSSGSTARSSARRRPRSSPRAAGFRTAPELNLSAC